MPYIKQEDRDRFLMTGKDPKSIGFYCKNPGELNYCLTLTVLGYLQRQGKSYRTINDIVGALESAKLEFYRRCVSSYEDLKIKENGDVF